MKILEIELKNLNSLRGHWSINLTEPVYESSGIFAITGPTGSGKTTIFDAICLALYGQTPRLGKISSKNEIMSRHTKECYARVIFEANGEKYISYWEQHRADRSGNLQPAKHVLSNFYTAKIISERLDETPRQIQNITGLDFKQFKQAVMLEQGGFDAFLRAGKNERAKILELLTGTDLYGKISELVFARTGEERQKLNDIKFRRDNLQSPNDNFDSEDEILDALSECKKNLEALEAEHDEAGKFIEWLKNISRIEDRAEENLREIQQHNKRMEVFIADERRLEAGLRASELLTDYAELKTQRENLKKTAAKIKNFQDSIDKDSAEISKITAQQLPDLEFELKRMKRNIRENETPESLRARATERLKSFDEIRKKKASIENEKLQAEKLFKQSQAHLDSAQKNFDSCSQRYEEARKKFDELVSVRLEAILEGERKKLMPGIPCPVCGSTEHPGISHDDSKNSDDVLKFDDALKLLRERLNTAKKEFDSANSNLQLTQSNESAARVKFDNLIKDFSDVNEEYMKVRNDIAEILDQMGIKVEYVNELRPSIDSWLKQIKTLEEDIKALNDYVQRLTSKIENNKNLLARENNELDILTGELEILQSNFTGMLHEKNFDDEEKFLAATLDSKELKNLQARKKELDDENNKLLAVKDDIARRLELEKKKSLTDKPLSTLETEFKERGKLIKDANEKIFGLKKNLEDRQKLKIYLEALNEKYNEQSEIFSKWDALNNLIGSAKGDKFRVFAQSVTLEMMINLANSQLEKMNGRYILTARPDSGGLELSVIDKEQGGEVRPTENLSGGERFIISLALALGLSQISGNKSRIDSLFLDEGFGSLDEESLNTALDALGELHRGGRMIGIISHVQALRERIAAQINVIPQHDGTSIIKTSSNYFNGE